MPLIERKIEEFKNVGCDRAFCLSLKLTFLTGTLTLIFDFIFFKYLIFMSGWTAQMFFAFLNPIVVWRWVEATDWLYLFPMVYFYHFIFFGITFTSFQRYRERKSESGVLWLFLFAILVWAYLVQTYLFLILMGIVY